MQNLLDSVETMEQSMREFRQARAEVVREKYYETHCDKNSYHIRDELYDRMLRILGKNKHFLIEFAERDAECLSLDTDYFYNYGFADCILFLYTYNRVGMNNETVNALLKRIIENGEE